MRFLLGILVCVLPLIPDLVRAEGELPVGAVARLGSNHFSHHDSVRALAFSPDGSSIMSIATDRVFLWDVKTAEKLEDRELPDHMTPVFDPRDSTLELMQIDPPSRYRKVRARRVHAELWNALDPTLFFATVDGKRTDVLEAIDFSPDQTLVTLARRKEAMQVLRVEGQSEPVILEGEPGFREWLQFSPDGKQLAGSCEIRVGPRTKNSRLRIWDVTTGKKIRDIGGGSNDGAYSPNGKLLASCGLSYVNVSDVETGKVVRKLVDGNVHTSRVAFSPDGKLFATAQDNRIRIWETDSWTEPFPASAHDEKVNAVVFSPDGKRILTGGHDSRLIEWNWPEATERRRRDPVGSSWGIFDLSYSKEGRYLGVTAWINYDHPFSVWDADTWEVYSRFGKKNQGRTRLEFRKGGKEVISGQGDGSIAIWKSETGTLIRKVGKHEGDTLGIAIPPSAEGSAWWAGDYQGLGLRDLKTGEDVQLLKGAHHHAFGKVELSSDERFLAVSGELWDLKTGEHLLEDYNVRESAFSPDSRLFASSKGDHIDVWEFLSRSVIHTIGIGAGDVHDLAFSPDGTVIAAGGNGSTLIWDMTGILKHRTLPELDLSNNEMEALWETLGSEEDPWEAHLAAWKFSASGEIGIQFLRRRLRPAKAPTPDHLRELRSQFKDETYDVRELAARELLDLGITLTPKEWDALRRPLPNYSSIGHVPFLGAEPDKVPGPEFQKVDLQYGPPPKLVPLPARARFSRAIKALENSLSPVSSRALLKELSLGDPNSPQTMEARSALDRVQGQ